VAPPPPYIEANELPMGVLASRHRGAHSLAPVGLFVRSIGK